MTSAARKIQRSNERFRLTSWARDLRRRGYNIRYVKQVRDAAWALFLQAHADELQKGKVYPEDLYAAGFDAGLRSIEYVNQEAVDRGEPQELVQDARDHYVEIQAHTVFPLASKKA